MNDGAMRVFQAFEGAPDQLLARLGQHLDGDVGRDLAIVDEVADEIEIGLGCRGKAHLDLLEAHGDEPIEHAHLALGPHGFDERLISVSEIDRAPDGRSADGSGGPLPVGKIDGRKGSIFLAGIDHHVRGLE
jgi:hypothetical protein